MVHTFADTGPLWRMFKTLLNVYPAKVAQTPSFLEIYPWSRKNGRAENVAYSYSGQTGPLITWVSLRH